MAPIELPLVENAVLPMEIFPSKADVATVSGLARYNFPGPERPWKSD